MAENLRVISEIVAKAKRKYRIQSSLKEIDDFWDSQAIKTENLKVSNAIGSFTFVIFDRENIRLSLERATKDFEETAFLCSEFADLKTLHERAIVWHDKLKLLLVALE